MMIVSRGEDLNRRSTREEMRDTLGPPLASGEHQGLPYDLFLTRRKIAEPWRRESVGMAAVSTFGFSELSVVPLLLGEWARRTIVGQRIAVLYEGDDVFVVLRDEDELPLTAPILAGDRRRRGHASGAASAPKDR